VRRIFSKQLEYWLVAHVECHACHSSHAGCDDRHVNQTQNHVMMKTKLNMLLTTLVLAAGTCFFATPVKAGLTIPGAVGHSDRYCGYHHHHHGHYWSCDGHDFWCHGHCD
jgi:hypothetical protein